MIGYVTLGTNDIEVAGNFYDELLASIGIKRMMDMETFIAWGAGMDKPGLSISKPFNGEPATVGNGVMVAIAMKSTADVDAFHAKAMSLGAADEGAPGPRGDGFYAGYFRDRDGNKLNAYCLT